MTVEGLPPEKETVSQVTKFPRLASLAEDNDTVVAELRLLADSIEKGEFGNNIAAIVVLDSDRGVQRHSIGGSGLSKIYVAGLLSFLLARLTNPDE